MTPKDDNPKTKQDVMGFLSQNLDDLDAEKSQLKYLIEEEGDKQPSPQKFHIPTQKGSNTIEEESSEEEDNLLDMDDENQKNELGDELLKLIGSSANVMAPVKPAKKKLFFFLRPKGDKKVAPGDKIAPAPFMTPK